MRKNSIKNSINIVKVLTVILLLSIAVFTLAGCGGDSDDNGEKDKPEPVEPNVTTSHVLKVIKSGWDYSKIDGKVYMAVIVENQSINSRCLMPEVEAIIYGDKNREIAREEMVLPGVDPGKTVAYGKAGKRIGIEPKKVEFVIKETDNWVVGDDYGEIYDSETYNYGTGAPSTSGTSGSDASSFGSGSSSDTSSSSSMSGLNASTPSTSSSSGMSSSNASAPGTSTPSTNSSSTSSFGSGSSSDTSDSNPSGPFISNPSGSVLIVKKTGTRPLDKTNGGENSIAALKEVEKSLDKLEKSLGGSTAVTGSYGSSMSSESDASPSEYYGTIVNKNDYTCKTVLVNVFFMDSSGKLKGGENFIVHDVPASGKKDVSVISFSDVHASKCRMYAYEW